MNATPKVVRPPGVTQAHLDFLDQLQKANRTNMFGGVPYLMQQFPDLSKDGAQVILFYWMDTR